MDDWQIDLRPVRPGRTNQKAEVPPAVPAAPAEPAPSAPSDSAALLHAVGEVNQRLAKLNARMSRIDARLAAIETIVADLAARPTTAEMRVVPPPAAQDTAGDLRTAASISRPPRPRRLRAADGPTETPQHRPSGTEQG